MKNSTLWFEMRGWSAAREADPTVGPDARFNALLPVLDKEAPAFIRADTAPQIETAVAFGARHDIDVVIVGGDEAMECVETLLAHDIPVVVHGTHRMPGRRDELWDHQYTLPGRLNEAGITVAIAANEPLHRPRTQSAVPRRYGRGPWHGPSRSFTHRDPVRG